MSGERINFGSKLGMVLATAGAAVGLGNVWRFPYMTGENGGAVFLLVYVFCILLLGIPCMVSEFIIGRRGAANTARAYAKLSNGKPWKYIGVLGVFTAFLITGYYAVVSGWCMQYVYASLAGNLSGNSTEIAAYFRTFMAHPLIPVVWTATILGITHYVITRGVRGGIEKASKLFMPTLFILLLLSVVASCLLPGAWDGIRFLFHPDWSKLNSDVFLAALGQAFYSLSIGMACNATFASYFNRKTNLLNTALQISFIDSFVAVLAGLVIFPAAFSVGVSPDSGPSLIFITLPSVFQQAFGSLPLVGNLVAVMFYALLTLAALTSLISLHEVSTVFICEEFKISRKKSATIVTLLCTLIGTFCSLSLGGREWLMIGGKALFDVFDFVTGQVFLPIGGLLTCFFLGWYVPKKLVRDELTNDGTLSSTFFHVYYFCLRYICPACILAIFLRQLGVI
ncbi:MAG: sodium-dependent transporter [Prevotellaceae bacterium]|nr:sodium-dependent transporter [Prevotellaceae bacterium]MDY3366444.1 sodium-dependent transporter [Prevotella sp.]